MKISEIYALAIEKGMQADPRGYEQAAQVLEKNKKKYEKLDEEEKQFFDQDRLINPYSDTRILCGDADAEVKSLLAGIDIEAGELMMADALERRGRKIDLIFSHHPEGRALLGLPDVMFLQTGYLASFGVLPNVAESLMEPRSAEVCESVNVSNYNRTVDAARLLGYNMMCVHTPCDNLANNFITELIRDNAPQTLDDVCKLIRSVPEYTAASRFGDAPMIISGNGGRSAGKAFVDFTGGTGGPKEYVKLLNDAGVSTLVCMHMRKEVLDLAKENHINVVIAGHMPSDSLGVNLFLDNLEAAGVDIVPCSGFTRISRN